MSEDSELIKVSETNAPSSLDSVVGKAVEIVPFKLLMLMFVIYLLLSSDVFNELILSNMKGAIGFGGKPSSYGTVITGTLLVIFVAVTDVLIKKHVI